MTRGDGSKGGGEEPGVEDGVVEVVLGCLHKRKSAVHLMPLSPSALSEAPHGGTAGAGCAAMSFPDPTLDTHANVYLVLYYTIL